MANECPVCNVQQTGEETHGRGGLRVNGMQQQKKIYGCHRVNIFFFEDFRLKPIVFMAIIFVRKQIKRRTRVAKDK